ncbi:MAG: Rne/Rng family ribonuclease [Actinomycetia bacterium]|nr:Rne/Rng family ribonuclease [Actinomycetes bacterium]
MNNSEPDVGIDVAASPSRAAAPRELAESAPAAEAPESEATANTEQPEGTGPRPAARKRRRGSRGGRNRKKPARPVGEGAADADVDGEVDDELDGDFEDDELDDDHDSAGHGHESGVDHGDDDHDVEQAARPELPDRISENRPSAEAASKALVRKPQIGDTRPAAPSSPSTAALATPTMPGQRQQGQPREGGGDGPKKKRRRGGKGRGTGGGGGGGGGPRHEAPLSELDADVLERRRGRERNGRPVGRYLMCVQVRPTLTQVAVLEGRTLIEHYVSRPADDVSQIHGNIYVGKVQNVLPGMEAAFVDIGTPKNAVLYRGDVQYDAEDIVEKSSHPRIEQMLRSKQLIVCQVTKNPIGAKGARLTQEVSMPGRFVVLIPNSNTYGISKRLPDDVRKRLRNILDRLKPEEHGLIVRTAAEHATEHELRADMGRLLDQWNAIEAKAKKAQGPTLLYREPELAVRVIREEFNADYRGVVIDDQRLFDDVHDYVNAFNPELADRVEFYDAVEDGLPVYERFHIHEQLHKALDRKVWLPSGGSLIIEHTEALTVIDVNTGKNVGTSNLEETVYRNNLEAAEEVAKQLRLRDIGGIVVIDFIDMEIRENRRRVVDAFRSALARDKTRTQVFEIGELGLLEMTRKRIGEGLLVSFADICPNCLGRGVIIDHDLLA